MRLLSRRGIPASAGVSDDCRRVLIASGPLGFSATRAEAVTFATAIVAAIDMVDAGVLNGVPEPGRSVVADEIRDDLADEDTPSEPPGTP